VFSGLNAQVPACRRQGGIGRPAYRQAGSLDSMLDLNIMFTVYVISSLTKNYIYVGLTSDMDRRFNEHNTGKEKTTRPYFPFNIIFTETHPDRKSARLREKYWKFGIGKENLRLLRDKL
jgi:putative endonuclease